MNLDNPFWHFSLKVYDEAGVADECLALQEALGIDVNVLLFCAWLGTRERKVSAGQVANIAAAARDWHEAVVRPLRAIRQRLKTRPEMTNAEVASLRKDIAASELRAEQIEQALLFAAGDSFGPFAPAPAAEAIAANVAAYLRSKTDSAPAPARLIAAATAYRPG